MGSYEIASGINQASTTIGKSSGGVFRTIFSVLGKNKFWTITFIVLLFILIGSIKEVAETKSPEPLLFNFIGLVIVPDENLYSIIKTVDETYPVKEVQESPTRWGTLMSNIKNTWNIFKWWWVVFSSLWMIWAVINFVRKLRIKAVNDSEKLKALLFALSVVTVLYLISTPVFYTYHRQGEQLPDWEEASKDIDFWISITPFKGTISLFKHIIFDRDYFNAGYERAKGMYNLTGDINGTGS